jgi:hypothetical protein
MRTSGFQPRFTVTNAIADAITRIERARGFLEAATLSDDWVDAMANRALALEAHHTTQMREVTSRCKRVVRKDLAVRKHDLNDRQSKALGYLVSHDEMRIQDLEGLCPGVTRRTLQRDLSKREDLGPVRQKGAARRASYVLGSKVL